MFLDNICHSSSVSLTIGTTNFDFVDFGVVDIPVLGPADFWESHGDFSSLN